MKAVACSLALVGTLLTPPARAQGPALDPSFRPGAVYQPAVVDQAIAQPDGKILLVTTASRVSGRPTNGQISRLLANSDQVDTVFAANVAGLLGNVLQAAVRPDNHIVLITGRGSLGLGGVSRLGILGLNPDGTVDMAFNAITTAQFSLSSVAAQPDGKVVVAGSFVQWAPGQTSPGLVRLATDGTLDAGFSAALGQSFSNPFIDFAAVQSDGSIVVGGRFDRVDGNAQSRLARLLPSGAFDASFRPVVPLPSAGNNPGVVWYPVGALTQLDGKVLVAGFTNQPMPAWPPLVRLLPSGALDPTFQTGTSFAYYFPYYQRASPLHLLADGKLLVGNTAGSFDGAAVGQLVRLTAAGRLDPTFPSTLIVPARSAGLSIPALALALLPGGQVLAAGAPARYAGDLVPTPLARLDSATGGRVAGFAPRVHSPGEVRDVLRQPDGRYVVGGAFTEINGSASPYLARLDAGGAVEPAFTAAAQPDNPVTSLALQADGKLVVGGQFQTLGGSVAPGVGRLLPGGAPDPAFAPAFAANTVAYPVVSRVVLEPSGQVLLLGNFDAGSGVTTGFRQLVRLDGRTGRQDPAFAPDYSDPDAVLVQPDGNILLGGRRVRVAGQGPVGLVRLLPSGALDPAFAPQPNTFVLYALARDPATGQIYASGDMGAAPAVLRFGPTGTRDLGYAPALPLSVSVRSLALQPNGRLLLGGRLEQPAPARSVGLVRLLPNGTQDPGFAPAAGPGPGVGSILVQADGAIVVAGTFTAVGGAPAGGLARLLDGPGLAVGAGRAPGGLAAWPVPAREVLHLRLDPAAGSARVALLDALGREVRALAAPGAGASLSVAGLPAGVYLLRVAYAAGPVVRRVAVE